MRNSVLLLINKHYRKKGAKVKRLIKIFILFVISTVSMSVILFASTCQAEVKSSEFKSAVKMYKSGNYIGSMQAFESIISKDQGDALANYYLAMSYAQTGNSTKAIEYYDKVIALDPSSGLAENARKGKDKINPPPPVEAPTVLPEKNTNKELFSEEAKKKFDDKNIRNIIDNINNNREVKPEIYERLPKFDKDNKESKGDSPTKEQVEQALDILRRATGLTSASSGISTPYAASAPQEASKVQQHNSQNSVQSIMSAMNPAIANPEIMQMNMLMNAMGSSGGGNPMNSSNSMGNMMNMMPLLMMMQNSGGANSGNTANQIDPQIMQTMLSTMMMPGMMNLYSNKNDD